MELRAEEISRILRDQIADFDQAIRIKPEDFPEPQDPKPARTAAVPRAPNRTGLGLANSQLSSAPSPLLKGVGRIRMHPNSPVREMPLSKPRERD